MTILFSIIIPTYNRAHLLRRALDSLIRQSYKNFEVIVVDDCSTDNTYDVIQEYCQDKRFKYFKNEVNRERSYSRNRGVELSSGSYICFLDSDDYLFDSALQDYYNLIVSTEELLDVIYSDYKFELPDSKYQTYDLEPNAEKFMNSIFYHGHLSAINFMIKKNIADLVKFDSNLIRNEDLEFNIRLVLTTRKFKHLKAYTYCAVEHGERSIYDQGQHKNSVRGYQLLLDKWKHHSDYKQIAPSIKKKLIDHTLIQLVTAYNLGKESGNAFVTNIKRIKYNPLLLFNLKFYRIFVSIVLKSIVR